MTEKKIPLSSSPNQDQNFKNKPEDEINLLDLVRFLVRKKVLIFFTASIIVVFSIFYAFSVTPIYRANIGFQPPEKNLTFLFPDFLHGVLPNVSRSLTGGLVIKENYMLNKFIAELQSYSNQEKVFMEGKFHERFVANNPKISIKKEIVREMNRSILGCAVEICGGIATDGAGLAAKVIGYDMKGVNPELASDYLNALADWVKNKIELDIREVIQKGLKVKIALLSNELKSRSTLAQLKHENEIRTLKDNIKIAKKLGILGNNFDNFVFVGSSFDHDKYINWPLWYLYGQRALEQELIFLERRDVSGEYANKTTKLNSKIASLSSIKLSEINFDTVTISMPSIAPDYPISTKKMTIILIGIVSGLIIGILLAWLSFLIILLKKRLKLPPAKFI